MISALIICKNEEQRIGACIEALLPVVDEVLVLDSGSEDATMHIAKQSGARVVETSWKGYAATKNEGHALVKFPYILSLDADEVLSPALQASILAVKQNLSGAYSFTRRTCYCGQWIRYAGWYPDVKVRLFPKETYWKGDFVHEYPVLPENTTITFLKGDLAHYTIEDKADHLARIHRYSELKAAAYFENGKSFLWYKAYLYPIWVFVKMYVLKLGFLEGRLGFQLCRISAYAMYVRQMKLKEKYKRGAVPLAPP